LVAALRANVTTVTEQIEEVVEEGITPIQEDQAAALEALAEYAVDVQDFITEAGGQAQATFDQYSAAAAAQQATLAQTYLTQAFNTTEQTVRISENEVLSEQINTVSAYLAGSGATIETIATAVANGDDSVATLITNVQSQANGNAAAINIITSSAGGTDANFGLVATQNGQIKAGFFLSTGAQLSTINFVAERFSISLLADEDTLVTPFVAGLVNGIPTVGITGNAIIDGTIIARHIVANSITADKLDVTSIATLYISDPDNIYYWDFGNGKQGRTDEKMVIDFKNITFVMRNNP
jgi:hypothetical protein